MLAESKVSIKPSLLYYEDGGKFVCKICCHSFSYKSNCIRHIHSHDVDLTEAISSFTYNGRNILRITEQLLLWKA